jgi:flagellar motor component MotA
MIPARNEYALILFIIGTVISLITILYLMYNFYARLESDDVGAAFIETVMVIESKKILPKPLKAPCVSIPPII